VELLTRATILRALRALGDRLPDGSTVKLVLAGGAALVVLYEARHSTKDVDAFLLDPGSAEALRRAASQVASDLGLPQDWLNDGVKGYVHGLALGEVIFDGPRLVVQALSPAQLLAMKLSAWRDDVDVGDARLLLSRLGHVRDIVWGAVEAHLVPGRELKAKYAFDDLWEAAHGPA
jgi:hypothetical protein